MTLYPNLEDHATVVSNVERPQVSGMSENVFFLDHREREAGVLSSGVSQHNPFEVSLTNDLIFPLILFLPVPGRMVRRPSPALFAVSQYVTRPLNLLALNTRLSTAKGDTLIQVESSC